MRRWVRAAIAALVLSPPATAFDNAGCGSFFIGQWHGAGQRDFGGQSGTYEIHSRYQADGTYTLTTTVTLPGAAPVIEDTHGVWQAKPGPAADACELQATTSDGRPKDLVLTVIDAQTLKTAGGIVETRE